MSIGPAMLCPRCGQLMYYAPLGNRWYHVNLNTLCPVHRPGIVLQYSTSSTT